MPDSYLEFNNILQEALGGAVSEQQNIISQENLRSIQHLLEIETLCTKFLRQHGFCDKNIEQSFADISQAHAILLKQVAAFARNSLRRERPETVKSSASQVLDDIRKIKERLSVFRTDVAGLNQNSDSMTSISVEQVQRISNQLQEYKTLKCEHEQQQAQSRASRYEGQAHYALLEKAADMLKVDTTAMTQQQVESETLRRLSVIVQENQKLRAELQQAKTQLQAAREQLADYDNKIAMQLREQQLHYDNLLLKARSATQVARSEQMLLRKSLLVDDERSLPLPGPRLLKYTPIYNDLNIEFRRDLNLLGNLPQTANSLEKRELLTYFQNTLTKMYLTKRDIRMREIMAALEEPGNKARGGK